MEFIEQFQQKYKRAPILRDIANAMGLNSLATVHEHLVTLQRRGLLKRTSGANRTMEIVKTYVAGVNPAVVAPVLGFIAAGVPIEPHTDPHATLDVPPSFVSGKSRVYVLQVRGDSMIEEQIRDGDFVIVEQTEVARNGDIVVALLDNGMATLKRFFKEATRIRLEPANSAMAPIFVKNVSIQGKMVGLIRKYLN